MALEWTDIKKWFDFKQMKAGIYDLIDFFEEGAANNVPVLDLVGNDVAEFAESALREMQAKRWTDDVKVKINKRVAEKLSKL